MSEREGPDPVQQGAEYLQHAAIEAIKAMRSLLDIAETVVREPELAATVGRAFAEAAASMMRPNHQAGSDEARERGNEQNDEEESTGTVRRIHLSD
ncbi:MAG: hypothetical protein QOI47_1557 [Actinomycetota bacterium]|nr:hypothetical protein [Actinomycetota bacterium]